MENFIEQMTISALNEEKSGESLPWKPHPAFQGVFMKDLVNGKDTEGRLSCHLVKIEPGCSIGNHIHDGKYELHEVVCGHGHCVIGEREIPYQPGSVTVIPENIPHSVKADESGLFLMAKFTPALN